MNEMETNVGREFMQTLNRARIVTNFLQIQLNLSTQ